MKSCDRRFQAKQDAPRRVGSILESGMKSSLPRFAKILLPALIIPVLGCGQAHANPPTVLPDPGAPPATAVAAPAAPTVAPPVTTVSLPPAPIPATFDVPALADKVKPEVVNITTTERVSS